MLVFGAFGAATPAHAALTSSQVSAILALLVSFNADQATIAKVQASLMGPVTPSAPAGTLSFMAGTQATNARIAPGAKNVPFTTFALTNNTGGAVTVYGITVNRIGSGTDAYLSSVALLDSSGNTVGDSEALDQSHQATLGGTFTLKAGETKTLTVAGSIASKNRVQTGKNLSLEVVSINASASLHGSLPVSGTSYTVDRTLKP
ncbi:MAG TPA: hypothetical protein VHD55_02635 [Candidatus Paceibacterota bacterium]|nr:hypothetical protein [Candidatus Paceibacterota bacterium]